MKFIDELTLKSRKYENLLMKWKEAINILTTPSKLDEVIGENYDIKKNNNKLEINIFGFKIHLRFEHAFDEGVIQYFVINDDAHNESIEILYSLRFDGLGNFKNEGCTMWHIPDFKSTNAMILNELLDDLAKKQSRRC